MVLELGLLQEQEDCYALMGPFPPLAIPATLHDSLMGFCRNFHLRRFAV
jgi:hypothetical protein